MASVSDATQQLIGLIRFTPDVLRRREPLLQHPLDVTMEEEAGAEAPVSGEDFFPRFEDE